MDSDETRRVSLCGQRYDQRQRSGKAGWADEAAYRRFEARIDDILRDTSLPGRMHFLELGCGNGNIALYMAGKGHEAYGVDIVPEAIRWAERQTKERHIVATFDVGSVVTLTPYKADFFDFVFDANCLFMIVGKEDRRRCLKSISRVLRDGGIFCAIAHLLDESVHERVDLGPGVWFDPLGQLN